MNGYRAREIGHALLVAKPGNEFFRLKIEPDSRISGHGMRTINISEAEVRAILAMLDANPLED